MRQREFPFVSLRASLIRTRLCDARSLLQIRAMNVLQAPLSPTKYRFMQIPIG